MTEAEWLAGSNVDAMLDLVSAGQPTRRLRLFGAASCRLIWEFLWDERERQVVVTLERFADGQATDAERTAVSAAFEDLCDERRWKMQYKFESALPGSLLDDQLKAHSAKYWAETLTMPHYKGAPSEDELNSKQADMLRDIFGNPYRPVAFDPRWRTADAVGLARGIYEERAFERLPLLADALMDAGCGDEPVLAHCRSEGPHVRGCWVVDLVLGKE
jgi:hypothetical protein